MKMLFGAIVVDGRNKIQGHVASKNRFGSYLRTKVTPVNPNTSYQSNVRTRLTTLTQNWSGVLTNAQRAQWRGFANQFPYTDIFGQSKFLTGHLMYVRLNSNILAAGGTAIVAPPANLQTTGIVSMSVAADESSDTVIITPDPISLGSDELYFVYATQPMSPGINFVKSQYRLLGAYAAGATVDVSANYISRFGNIGTADIGKRVFTKIAVVNDTTGAVGQAMNTNTLVVA